MGLTPRSVFVTGANRGIGFGLVKAFTEMPQPPTHLFASCRDVDSAKDLQELAASHPNIKIICLDVNDHQKYPDIVKEVEETVGEAGLNILINNAAVSDRYREDERTIETVHASILRETFETNAISPLLLTQAFLPLLRTASNKVKSHKMSCSKAAVVNITSQAGSIEYNEAGNRYPYRSSKAALNMITKSMSIDLLNDGILAVVLHPGWTQTRMGGPNAPTPLSESIEGLITVLGRMNEKHTGKFLSYSGHEIPW